MNIRQKIKLHDRLYRHADRLIRKHNPCKIENGKCAYGKFCCNDCEHLTETGCSIECLMCKLHLCWFASNNNLSLSKTFKRMQSKAYRHNIVHFRKSKEQVTKSLYLWKKLEVTNKGDKK
jgi:hypothetical protein